MLMKAGGVVANLSNRTLMLRESAEPLSAAVYPSALKAFASMSPESTYAASATKVKLLGTGDPKTAKTIESMMEISPDVTEIFYTGLSAVTEDDRRALLFVDPERSRRHWVSADHERIIRAFEKAGYHFYSDSKRMVAVRTPGDTVGDLAVAVWSYPRQLRGEQLIETSLARESLPVPAKLPQVAGDGSSEDAAEDDAKGSEAENAEDAEPEDSEPETEPTPDPHPFGPGLDGPAPWEVGAEPGAKAELDAWTPPLAPTFDPSVSTEPTPAPAPTAPGLDLIIPARPVPQTTVPPISPVPPIDDSESPVDDVLALIERHAASPLAPWAAQQTVVGTDPSSTTIAGEVERVVDELRRAAQDGQIAGLNPVVAGALSKRITASDYWVAIKVQPTLPDGIPLDPQIVQQDIGGQTALVTSRPLVDLVDGENFQVLPPWVRQVIIATSVIEMVDQIKAAAKELGVAPLVKARA
jgi:hypothetical protein